MDPSDVSVLIGSAEDWTQVAINSAHEDPTKAAVLAQVALTKAVCGLAAAVLIHAERTESLD